MLFPMTVIRVAELFAGVGGFRLGLEAANTQSFRYKNVWASQWEPSTKKQDAAEIYIARFGSAGFSGEDIESVIETSFQSIPDHDLLVGGFPCQDYSVATTLKNSRGIMGKKGVLFWSIYTILKQKGTDAPRYIFLENVDRLLKSPASQRGKDFAIMLAALSDLGYGVEWRVINAADYGFPQRRRRIFIVGYRKDTPLYKNLCATAPGTDWVKTDGVLADAFPVQDALLSPTSFHLTGTLSGISTEFSAHGPKTSPFQNAGVMVNRRIMTCSPTPHYNGPHTTLGDVLLPEDMVPESFFIPETQLSKWQYLKGAKNEERQSSGGHRYRYTEGAMVFPDALDKPSRTIITGEGGAGASRFKHVIAAKDGRYRRLTPVELERLDMFPDGHTELPGVSDTRRAFICGNALVVGAITKVGQSLAKKLQP